MRIKRGNIWKGRSTACGSEHPRCELRLSWYPLPVPLGPTSFPVGGNPGESLDAEDVQGSDPHHSTQQLRCFCLKPGLARWLRHHRLSSAPCMHVFRTRPRCCGVKRGYRFGSLTTHSTNSPLTASISSPAKLGSHNVLYREALRVSDNLCHEPALWAAGTREREAVTVLPSKLHCEMTNRRGSQPKWQLTRMLLRPGQAEAIGQQGE